MPNKFFVCAPEYEVYADEDTSRRISYNSPINLMLTRKIQPDSTKDKMTGVPYHTIVFDGNATRWLFKTRQQRDEVLDGILDKVEL